MRYKRLPLLVKTVCKEHCISWKILGTDVLGPSLYAPAVESDIGTRKQASKQLWYKYFTFFFSHFWGCGTRLPSDWTCLYQPFRSAWVWGRGTLYSACDSFTPAYLILLWSGASSFQKGQGLRRIIPWLPAGTTHPSPLEVSHKRRSQVSSTDRHLPTNIVE